MATGRRPFNGLGIDEALAKWVGPDIPEGDALDYLIERLKVGHLLASGINKHEERDDYRKIIHPSMWVMFLIFAEFDEFGWEKRKYSKPEFFEPTCIPRNITDIPPWVCQYSDEARGIERSRFHHDTDYSHVEVGGLSFSFGRLQAAVIGKLHEAAKTKNPWLVGKVVLSDIGSRSTSISQIFKKQVYWRQLIESDGHGRYRLLLPEQDG